jgi:hypothetical protein
VWRTVERHALGGADYILLESKAMSLLRQNLPLDKLVPEAKDIAKEFAGLAGTSLTADHVLGLFFSLAAQSEALVDLDGGNA